MTDVAHRRGSGMTARERRRRAVAMGFWRIANPLARPLAGLAPWWVLLETTGRRSGRPRRVPLARGPVEGRTAWVICVHGRHSAMAYNIEANPRVRLKMRGRWHEGTAALADMDERILGGFSRYAQSGPRTVGIEPKLIRIELDP